jgi:hypothetical protein
MPLNIEPTQPIDEPNADAEPQEGVDFVTVQLRLPLRHYDWLQRRAALFGQEPAANAISMLLEYKAQHDRTGAANHRQAPPERGEMATTFRPR